MGGKQLARSKNTPAARWRRQNCTAGFKLAVDVGRKVNEAEERVDLPYRLDSTAHGELLIR